MVNNREVWSAAVAKGQTQLSYWTTTSLHKKIKLYIVEKKNKKKDRDFLNGAVVKNLCAPHAGMQRWGFNPWSRN